ncbi:MAG: 50S ribosomal protein L4 [Patescibacteria group bacterium]
MKATIYNMQGTEAGTIDLPEQIFNQQANNELVHQVYTVMYGNERQGTAHVKTRDEVRGGGAKPWKQKGTGRARHGSIRSPIWRGGGVTHGPRTERNWYRKINKKMRDKALMIVLSQKLRDGEIIFMQDLDFKEPKTAQAQQVLFALKDATGRDKLTRAKQGTVLLTTKEHMPLVMKSFANLPGVSVEELRKLSVVDILRHKYLIINDPQESIDFLQSKLS